MTNEELFTNAVEVWRGNKGVGTAIVPKTLNDKVLLYMVLTRIYDKNPNCETLIITNNFNERCDIIEFLTHQGDEENDKEFKTLIERKLIKILTDKFIITSRYSYRHFITILYNPQEINNYIYNILDYSKFRLVILNKLFKNNEDTVKLYKIAPLLSTFKQEEIEQLRLSTPVEEIVVGVEIPNDTEERKLYDYYTRYIETSINIFGSFDMISNARTGNSQLNISAASICAQIAEENGWNEHLDMSIEYNRQIDELYNPNQLRDRATNTYEIIRNRSKLVADNTRKLDKIFEIVNNNKDKKILIINKRGEFANKVTDYLNNLSEEDICGNYHDKAENIPAVDANGNPVFYKSGDKKGERKYMGYQMQKTYNVNRFNSGKIHVLSTSNSPDKDLAIDVDIVIITSPLCESIESYLYRLSNVTYTNGKVELYSIFCKNTIEQKQIMNKNLTETHQIVNKNEFDAQIENNSTFFAVD